MTETSTTIIVPVDGSSCSMRALALAADLAARFPARLRLVHASYRRPSQLPHAERLVSEMAAASQYTEEEFTRLAERTAREVFAKARQALEGRPLDVEEVMIDGDPARGIIAQAAETPNSMIVLGRSGMNRAEELLLGSVSHRVVHKAPCPVTVVS